MSPLSLWRAQARACIPGGFVRLSTGDGLLVSDYPRRGKEEAATRALTAAGFSVEIRRGLALIDGRPEKYRALMAALPPVALPPPREETLYLWGLARRLTGALTPVGEQPIAPVRLTLRCLDGGDFPALARRLPPLLALLQRQGERLPSAAGTLIARALWEREEESC